MSDIGDDNTQRSRISNRMTDTSERERRTVESGLLVYPPKITLSIPPLQGTSPPRRWSVVLPTCFHLPAAPALTSFHFDGVSHICDSTLQFGNNLPRGNRFWRPEKLSNSSVAHPCVESFSPVRILVQVGKMSLITPYYWTMRDLDWGGLTEEFPPHRILLEGLQPSGPIEARIGQLIATRQHSGHTRLR
jgi:hypothetical protein